MPSLLTPGVSPKQGLEIALGFDGLSDLEAAQQRLSFSTTYEHKQLRDHLWAPTSQIWDDTGLSWAIGASPFSGTSLVVWHTENFLSVHNILTSALSKAFQ